MCTAAHRHSELNSDSEITPPRAIESLRGLCATSSRRGSEPSKNGASLRLANRRSGATAIVIMMTIAMASRIAITSVEESDLPMFWPAMKLNVAISAMWMTKPTAWDAATALTAGPVGIPRFCM